MTDPEFYERVLKEFHEGWEFLDKAEAFHKRIIRESLEDTPRTPEEAYFHGMYLGIGAMEGWFQEKQRQANAPS